VAPGPAAAAEGAESAERGGAEEDVEPSVVDEVGAAAFAAEAESVAAQGAVIELSLAWASTLLMHGFYFGVGSSDAHPGAMASVAVTVTVAGAAAAANRDEGGERCALATVGATMPLDAAARVPLAVSFEAMVLVMMDELSLFAHSKTIALTIASEMSASEGGDDGFECFDPSSAARLGGRRRSAVAAVAKRAAHAMSSAASAVAGHSKQVMGAASRSAWGPVAVDLARSVLARLTSQIERGVGARGGRDWKNLDACAALSSAPPKRGSGGHHADCGAEDSVEGVHWQSLIGLLHAVELFVLARPTWFDCSAASAEDEPLFAALALSLGGSFTPDGGTPDSATPGGTPPVRGSLEAEEAEEAGARAGGLARCSLFASALRHKKGADMFASPSSAAAAATFSHRVHTAGTWAPLDIDILTAVPGQAGGGLTSQRGHALRNCEAYDHTLPPLRPAAVGGTPRGAAPSHAREGVRPVRRVGVHIAAPPPPPGWPWSVHVEEAADWADEAAPPRPQRRTDTKCCQDAGLVASIIKLLRKVGFGAAPEEWQHKARHSPATALGKAMLSDCSAALARFEEIHKVLHTIDSLAWQHYERRYAELGALYQHSMASDDPSETFARLAASAHDTTEETRAIRDSLHTFLLTGKAASAANPYGQRGSAAYGLGKRGGSGRRNHRRMSGTDALREALLLTKRTSLDGLNVGGQRGGSASGVDSAEPDSPRRIGRGSGASSNLLSAMTHGKFGEGKHRAALFAALRGKKLSEVSSTAAAGAVGEAAEAEEADGDAVGVVAGGDRTAAATVARDMPMSAGIPVLVERESERDSAADAALEEVVTAMRTRGEERSGTLTAGDLVRADVELASSSGGPMHAPTLS
jgi:hypothetical protein